MLPFHFSQTINPTSMKLHMIYITVMIVLGQYSPIEPFALLNADILQNRTTTMFTPFLIVVLVSIHRLNCFFLNHRKHGQQLYSGQRQFLIENIFCWLQISLKFLRRCHHPSFQWKCRISNNMIKIHIVMIIKYKKHNLAFVNSFQCGRILYNFINEYKLYT